MKPVPLALQYALCVVVFGGVAHARTSTSQVRSESLLAQQSELTPPVAAGTKASTIAPSSSASPRATAGQSAPPELAKIESTVRPCVLWVTVFDPKGNLLRTESGFFISADGRFVTTAHAVDGAINAVTKTGDGGIYNVSGILAASKALDLAVLQAEVKPRKLLRFLELEKNEDLSVGTRVAVVGSPLAGSEGNAREMTISAGTPDRLEIAGATPASSIGAPVVNEDGGVVGVVTSAGEKTTARPVAALGSLLSGVAVDTQARWPATAEARATPKPTPKPRLVYAPAPAFPPGASLPGQSGTGRFRLTFDVNGNVTNVQVIKSTGNPYFDQSAIKTLHQWRSAPGQGWAMTVPVTFQAR